MAVLHVRSACLKDNNRSCESNRDVHVTTGSAGAHSPSSIHVIDRAEPPPSGNLDPYLDVQEAVLPSQVLEYRQSTSASGEGASHRTRI